MGYNAEMAEKAIPDLKDVMKFISKFETPAFPGEVDQKKSEEGKIVFRKHCQLCHGTYEGTSVRNKLVSFPNQLLPVNVIKTDSVRCKAISENNLKTLDKLALKKYFDARINTGYVAPILLGIWATAPYFHNGSVPTLWHLMHPELRPEKFYSGGHQLDYEKIGIKGEMQNGVYKYPAGYTPFSDYEIYDTKEIGLSNSGHYQPFESITEYEKSCLLEFLKTL
jgi:hypothetical protein